MPDARKKLIEARRARIRPELPGYAIKDDRELLAKLQLDYAEAVMLLGKQRQALNNKLGPQSSEEPCEYFDYFGLGEIILLFESSRKMGKEISLADLEDIRAYVHLTRKPHADDYYESDADRKLDLKTYELFEWVLAESAGFDFSRLNGQVINGIVVLMRDVNRFKERLSHEAKLLKTFVQRLKADHASASVIALSSTAVTTDDLAFWLGESVDPIQVSNQVADHYPETVLLYRAGYDQPLALTVYPNTGLVEATTFRTADMASCVRSMLSKEIRSKIYAGSNAGAAQASSSAGG